MYMCLLACYVVTCSLLRLDVQIDVNSILKECRRAYKVLFILKVYVFLKPLEPVDLTWFKLRLKKTNKQTKVNANSGSAESVMVKSILKRQENQRKKWNSTRDGVLPTPKQKKTKESGNNQKNKTNKTKH